MKKNIILYIIISLIIIPLKVNASSSYVVMEPDTKRIISQSNISEQKLIASTTKIMTAIVTLEKSNINKTITVPKEVLKAYGSNIYIEMGEKLKLKDLLYGLMLRSGNDAAITIANSVCKNEEEFVKLMNKKAKKLHMKNTIFYNPHGLENENGIGNKSSAYDMGLLISYAIKNKEFTKITSTKYYSCKSSKKSYTWKNKNKLVFSYPYTIAGKTGFTKKARRTLVSAAKKDNKKLVIVTLNYADDFNFHKNMYEKYFNRMYYKKIIDKKHFNIKPKYYKKYILYVNKNYGISYFKDDIIKTKIKLKKKRFIKKGEVVGHINIYLNNKLIKNINIHAKRNKND